MFCQCMYSSDERSYTLSCFLTMSVKTCMFKNHDTFDYTMPCECHFHCLTWLFYNAQSVASIWAVHSYHWNQTCLEASAMASDVAPLLLDHPLSPSFIFLLFLTSSTVLFSPSRSLATSLISALIFLSVHLRATCSLSLSQVFLVAP